MNGLPVSLRTLMDAPQYEHGSERQPGLRMLDGRDGPVRLVFESGISWRHAARLDRWLAILWPSPPAGTGARMIWLLDASTVRWSGRKPPGELYRGLTGFASEEQPVLWFRAGDEIGKQRGYTASGVFAAAGIVDAARVRVAAFRKRRRVRLRMSIDTGMWGLSAVPADSGYTGPGGHLRIKASGVLRPLEPRAIAPWL